MFHARVAASPSRTWAVVFVVPLAVCLPAVCLLAEAAHAAAPPSEAAAPLASPPVESATSWQSSAGGQLSLDQVVHGLTIGVGLFFELAPPESRWSTRLSVRRIQQDRDALVRPDLLLQVARWEGCWIWLSSEAWSLSLAPCAGIEGGVLSADNEISGPWLSAVGHLRLSWEVSRRVALQVQSGVNLGFIDYDDELRSHGLALNESTAGAMTAFGMSIQF